MKRIKALLLIAYYLLLNGLVAGEDANDFPQKTVIIGGGIIGAMESYHAYLNAIKTNRQIQIVVYDKSPSFEEGAITNTAYHICPSLTPDEILSVVPRGSELVEKLAFLFSQPGGIRVDDVPGVNDSLAATRFKQAVEIYGQDPNHEDRTASLLMLGKMSMDLWQNLYDEADSELKGVLERSNFNPCRESRNENYNGLHDGYRIDLIYDVSNAQQRAQEMQKTYAQLGYRQCKLLSASEVMAIDPTLNCFCMEHSELNDEGGRIWKKDAAALWRPGGCLATLDFLPSFYTYLKKIMGTYVDPSGQIQDRFRIEFNKEVVGVDVDESFQIIGVKLQDGSLDLNDPAQCHYVFCPGESVGTLKRLGFDEPAYAGFAGASLTLKIPLSSKQMDDYKHFNHCMEVHKVGIVLAWQARCKGNQLLLQAGGTKAFYGDQAPQIHEAFATNRHLVQLNVLNDVLPEMVSIACNRDTKGSQLTVDDLCQLEEKGMLNRWVGRRAVAYDGFPTLGALFMDGQKIKNARCTTHLGSGGVSFAPAAVQISRRFEETNDPFTTKILQYGDSRR